jgi:cytochrome c
MRKIALIVLIGMMMAGIAWAKDVAVPTTRDEVVSFVKEAVAFAKENGKEAALKEFMKRDGKFVRGELYIFAYDFSGTVIAHGGQPDLVGKNLIDMKDPNGVMILKEIIKLAKGKGGWLDYDWPNPLHGNAVEPKSGYVLKVDDTWFLGSGLYTPKQK